MPRIGIVGGVGPLAAAHFYQRLIQLSPATRDDDHFPVVLVSDRIPSRVDHLVGDGPSPVPALQRVVGQLVAAGVDLVTVPSATTTAYVESLRAVTDLPIVDLLVETARVIAGSDCREVVVLATRATAALTLYERTGLCGPLRYPDPADQRRVDAVIDGVKRGDPLPALRARLADLVASYAGAGDTAVVLGCTELGVVAPPAPVGVTLVDAADVLAQRVVERCATLVAAGDPSS